MEKRDSKLITGTGLWEGRAQECMDGKIWVSGSVESGIVGKAMGRGLCRRQSSEVW